ncbi:DUF6489 family protein [Sandaracinobacteroides sp. A072]|uniref:DUF6489 family protein n=1 Tax=Sandaracinobacteroides sp. A072 TaxID=3461146 RepID=UPI00404339D1
MKIEIEIEATPQEVRTFFGLPDLTPLHEAWVERMNSLAMNGPTQEDWNSLMQGWARGMPGMNEGLEAWQKMMGAMSGSPQPERKAKPEPKG